MAKQEEWYKQHSGRVFGNKEQFVKSRKYVALKILSRIGGSKAIQGKSLLDIGCSIGLITDEYANYAKKAVGVDIDKSAIAYAKQKCKKAKCMHYKGKSLPFKDNSFDVIICNFVIEHVENQRLLMDEIYKVLKKNGICYISTDNKWRIIEAHYKLPFLSYLPKPLANIYLRIAGKGQKYYEKLPTYAQFRKLCKRFQIINLNPDIIKNPKKYHVKKLGFFSRNILRKMKKKNIEKFSFLMPSFNFILIKK